MLLNTVLFSTAMHSFHVIFQSLTALQSADNFFTASVQKIFGTDLILKSFWYFTEYDDIDDTCCTVRPLPIVALQRSVWFLLVRVALTQVAALLVAAME